MNKQSTVSVRRSDGLVEIRLNRPPVNALNGDVQDGIAAAFQSVSSDEVAVLLADGRHFCAGQDLSEHQAEMTEEESADALRRGIVAITSIVRCRGPVVVGVHGAAVGAGTLYAAAADVVLCTENSHFSLPELRVGVAVGYSVAARFFPPAIVRRMLLTGERVSASQLASMGLVTLVAPEQLDERAREVARQVAEIPSELRTRARDDWGDEERSRTTAACEAEVEAHVAATA